MPDHRRGATWRAAWFVAAVAVFALWRVAIGRPDQVIQIEFGMYPELFVGAQVLVDDVVVGELERRGSRTLNGFRVEEGERRVALRKEGYASEPVTVAAGESGPGPTRLLADIEDRYEGDRVRPVLVLRR